MKSKIYIIFDCYKTLIFKKNLEETISQFACKEFNKNVSVKSVQKALDIVYDKHKFIHPQFNSKEEREKYYILYNKELLEILGLKSLDGQAQALNKKIDTCAKYAIYEDVLETLQYFHNEKILLGILANWTAGLEKILQETGILKYFDIVRSSSQSRYAKPDPKFFEELLHGMIGNYGNIYYVGDDYELDIIPARLAGLIPVLVDRQLSHPGVNDCIKVKSLTDLKNIIKIKVKEK
ncbi:MAG: HAD family hydrolase [Patescibacteria group bacterium]